MTQKRQEQIKTESERRINEWLQNSSFDEMTIGGSYLRFDMALGLNGYPFEKEKWMKNKKFNKFITDNEYESKEYEQILFELYLKYKQ